MAVGDLFFEGLRRVLRPVSGPAPAAGPLRPAGVLVPLRALVEKEKGKYRLRDFSERGEDEKLGQPDGATPAPLVDVLHRTLWLMENQPALLGEFLDEALAGRAEPLRLVAHTLAGPALAGEEARLTTARGPEASALRKLTGNWRSLVEENLFRRRE